MNFGVQSTLWKQAGIAVCAFVLTVLQAHSALPQVKESIGENQPLRLVISSDKHAICPGEELSVRVSLENEGVRDVFVRRDIYNGTDTFDVYLRHGGDAEGPISHFAGDTFDTVKPSLATHLSRKWLALAPGKFYGTVVVLDARDYPRLRIPGRYSIYGQYSSSGFRQDLRPFVDEAAELPFKAWEGRLRSNSIWIKVRDSCSQ